MKQTGSVPPPAGQSAASGEAAIAASHLTKKSGDRTAATDVPFGVAQGEVFGFLGPNRAGRTTMVRILRTLIAPTSGSAMVAGMPLTPAGGAQIRQRMVIMPEVPGPSGPLSVRENLEFLPMLACGVLTVSLPAWVVRAHAGPTNLRLPQGTFGAAGRRKAGLPLMAGAGLASAITSIRRSGL